MARQESIGTGNQHGTLVAFTSMVVGEDHMVMLHITNGALSRGCLALGCTTTTFWNGAVVDHASNLSTTETSGKNATSFRSSFRIKLLSLAPGRILHNVGATLALSFLRFASLPRPGDTEKLRIVERLHHHRLSAPQSANSQG